MGRLVTRSSNNNIEPAFLEMILKSSHPDCSYEAFAMIGEIGLTYDDIHYWMPLPAHPEGFIPQPIKNIDSEESIEAFMEVFNHFMKNLPLKSSKKKKNRLQ